MNKVIILSGGIGTRANTIIPKQFIDINGKPLIIYTLEKFSQNTNIDEIYVVCVEGWLDFLKNKILEFNISKIKGICIGGKTGLESVNRGLKLLKDSEEDDLILIHDAVRPFVDQESIDDNIKVATKFGVAMCCVDCFETLVKSDDGIYANKIIPRDGIKRVLTPQTFRYSILKSLYKNVDFDTCKEPSTFSFYMSKGFPIYCSKGNSKNIKVTYPDDIQYFKKMFG